MSMSEQEVGQLDVSLVSDLTIEPRYISEIARTLRELNLPRGMNRDQLEGLEFFPETWGQISHNNALTRVMIALDNLTSDSPDEYDVYHYDYDVEDRFVPGSSQRVGSMHLERSEEGLSETKKWRSYSVIHNVSDRLEDAGSLLDETGWNELANKLRREINPIVTVEDKLNRIRTVSRTGNEQSRLIENLMQGQLGNIVTRSGEPVGEMGLTGYSDPSVDFYAIDFTTPDGTKFDNGLIVEITSRWVNPIGDPYISSKSNSSIELEKEHGVTFDVIVIAPKFADGMKERYETSDIIYLKEFPTREGNPVVIQDSPQVRGGLSQSPRVGDDYPVVDRDFNRYIETLNMLNREYTVLPEWDYRQTIEEMVLEEIQ